MNWLAKKRTYHASKVFHAVKKRHKLKKLAFYTTVNNRRNFEHFLDDGAIFITPTVRLTPPPHPPVFLPKVTRIFCPFLLVDGRALRQPVKHFYWSTVGENRQLASICRQANHWGVLADLIPSEQGLYMPIFLIFLFLTTLQIILELCIPKKSISQNSFLNLIYIFPKSFIICQELQDPKRNYEYQIWT